MTVPTYYIAKSDKLTHSRTITLENLIELFKEKVGAPETAKVLFNYSLGELKRKIEISWTDDEATEKTRGIPTETTYGGHPAETPFEEWRSKHPCPPPTITLPVATGDVQVGDLVMVSNKGASLWAGPYTIREIEINQPAKYLANGGYRFRWGMARHLTDEERAQIERI